MALNSLPTGTMVELSAPWLDPKKLRPTLAGLSRVAPLLPDLEAAHRGLLTAQFAPPKLTAKLAALIAREAVVDAAHDQKIRGLFGILTGLADLADSADERALYLDLRNLLFPDGLLAVNKGYLDEAGQARLAGERLDDPVRKQLEKLPLPKRQHLLAQVESWLAQAAELGTLEASRAELERSLGSDAQPVRRADAARARNRWIRVVRAFTSNLDLENLEAADRATLTGALDREVAKHERTGHPDSGDAPTDSAPSDPASPQKG